MNNGLVMSTGNVQLSESEREGNILVRWLFDNGKEKFIEYAKQSGAYSTDNGHFLQMTFGMSFEDARALRKHVEDAI